MYTTVTLSIKSLPDLPCLNRRLHAPTQELIKTATHEIVQSLWIQIPSLSTISVHVAILELLPQIPPPVLQAPPWILQWALVYFLLPICLQFILPDAILPVMMLCATFRRCLTCHQLDNTKLLGHEVTLFPTLMLLVRPCIMLTPIPLLPMNGADLNHPVPINLLPNLIRGTLNSTLNICRLSNAFFIAPRLWTATDLRGDMKGITLQHTMTRICNTLCTHLKSLPICTLLRYVPHQAEFMPIND